MKYEGYLIDLDGTMYNGNTVIDGAIDFIDRLNQADIPYVFLTNNATKTQAEAAQKLIDMGFDIHSETLYTSAMATAAYLEVEAPGASVHVIGTDSLRSTLEAAGCVITDDSPDFVVMGLDRQITYDKLALGARLISAGAGFISTNPDRKFPSDEGLLPGNGALVSVLASTTDVEPIVIGKPKGIILEAAIKALGLPKDNVLLVGDNYDTDILTGLDNGVDTLHVNTGVTRAEIVKEKAMQPAHMINQLSEWSVE
ncbi:TIGR01457 family HAD-type hydrolase [Salinicoccus cyprini]|uniref:Acid sugar phosphatase n=1 Tax=Salinicoccus cyprini TaxID=2493691 RepID=A0A558AWU4_9STAP|nr:TIGR01457 family HAD-type hydrolase [Salinicoccus cyprini]TVT28736.1 TIGR01457 family HAD-type hydrolase [Salinicoccus cyprini]